MSRRDERYHLWRAVWILATRANVVFQLLGGALLVALVDLIFMVRARFGYTLGPPDQSWPRWTLIAIPAGVTLLWLTLATTVIVATYRQWQRQRQLAQLHIELETQPDESDQRP